MGAWRPTPRGECRESRALTQDLARRGKPCTDDGTMTASFLKIGFLKGSNTWLVRALIAILALGAGCASDGPTSDPHNQPFVQSTTVKMELRSNLPDTLFYTRLRKVDAAPNEGWKFEGQGQRVQADLFKGGRYEIKASHSGYNDKFATLTEPIPRFEFKFVRGDLSPLSLHPTPDPSATLQHPQAPVLPHPPSEPQEIGQRWAVVIGLSEYKDHRIPKLRYAARDARAFHGWLTSQDGARYSLTNTRLLLDQAATAQAIRDVLYVWLGQALEEDLVVIYFSGHGTPESPDRPENLYLVPHDAKFDRIASTGFPMWDVEEALKRHIKARKVVVIADACHAGGVGAEFVDARRAIGRVQAGHVTQGLVNLEHASDGVAVLLSADTNELSQESEKWGGGHGVFTYYLLKGLRGDGDFTGDSRVTLAELTQYVTDHVRRDTLGAQRPRIAGDYDPSLTLAR